MKSLSLWLRPRRKFRNIFKLFLLFSFFWLSFKIIYHFRQWSETGQNTVLFSLWKKRPELSHICESPRLSLVTDSLRNFFVHLPQLRCQNDIGDVFLGQDPALGVYVLNESLAREMNWSHCDYEAIDWADDSSFVYSHVYRQGAPEELIEVENDFFRVTCYPRKTKEQRSSSEAVKAPRKVIFRNATNFSKVSLSRGENGNQTLALRLFASSFAKHISEDAEKISFPWFEPGGIPPTPFQQFFSKIHEKSEVKNRAQIITVPDSLATTPRPYNVAILALDSLSRLSFQRLLPKSYRLMSEELGSVVLRNYHVVGDGTNANVVPLLTGFFDHELPECRNGVYGSGTPDAWPLIWQDFRSRGYVTLFAEDSPAMGLFSLRLNGFQSRPTDHYLRPFWQAMESTGGSDRSAPFCFGAAKKHRITFDYLEEFLLRYGGVPKFAFAMHVELSHSDNSPVQYADEDLAAMLKRLRDDDVLVETFFLLMSDHGARFSEVRMTTQGKLEERLPMMAIFVPPRFRVEFQSQYQNLKRNAEIVTSPFDVHATLREILELTGGVKSGAAPFPRRGDSLFAALPSSRRCVDAGVSDHWCTCLERRQVDVGNAYVKACAQAVVDALNAATLQDRFRCRKLILRRVTGAQLVVPNDRLLRFSESRDADHRIPGFREEALNDVADYEVEFTAEPVDDAGAPDDRDAAPASFQANVRVHLVQDEYVIDGGVEGVSRVDRYASLAECVKNSKPHLRKFCLCK